jgi:putative SOS response-associated peptidase YedK
MCGRFAITASDAVEIAEDLAREFGIVLAPKQRERLRELHRARYNVAPGQNHWLITSGLEVHHGQWGFENPRHPGLLFNARSESVERKPTFAESFRRGRALLFCDGFYEWNSLGDRQPWLFRPQGLSLFALAALIDQRAPAAQSDERMPGDVRAPFCVLTVPANEMIGPLHPRMPALLGRRASREWLQANTAPKRAQALLRPAPVSAMSRLRVDSYVNDPAHDDPRCFGPPRQSSLF